MTRLHRDFLGGSLSSAVSASGTGSDVLHSAAFVSVGLVASPDVLAVSLNPDGLRGEAPEIVHVTSHALGANTLLATRGQEGTARRAWPSGTPWVHALTALDADAAASGGGGGGGVAFGPVPPPIVTTLADVATDDSYYGGAAVRFLTWTPTRSGLVQLAAPANDPDTFERDYLVFKGTVANVDYPDTTDASGSWPDISVPSPFDGDIDAWVRSGVAHPSSFICTAGQTYTIGVAYWDSAPYDGRSISVAELWGSLEPFGGVTPLVPVLGPTPVAVLPDGSLTIIPSPYDPTIDATISGRGSWATGTGTATGAVSTAEGAHTIADGDYTHAEGGYSHASGNKAHAEGDHSTASGYAAHAEGNSTTASGDHSHAEGSSSQATALGAHAEGGSVAQGDYSHAEGFANTVYPGATAAHAEGYNAYATRVGEHVQGGGQTLDSADQIHVVSASRLLFRGVTTDGSLTLLTPPNGVGSHLLRTGPTLIHGYVLARHDAGSTLATANAVVQGWELQALCYHYDVAELIGSAVNGWFATGSTGWTCGIDVDPTLGIIKVMVEGAAGQEVTWSCMLDLLEG